jgi:signal transduction histidine kinase
VGWPQPVAGNQALRLGIAVVAYGAFVLGTRAYGVVVLSGSPRASASALVSLAVCLPIMVWLGAVASERVFGPRESFGLSVLGLVVAGSLPAAGAQWIGTIGVVAGLALGGLSLPWALIPYAVLAAAPAPLAVALGAPAWVLYFGLSFPFVSLPIAMGLRLVRGLRQLQQARLELAKHAVVTERVRVDSQIQEAIGSGLETIAAQARAAIGRLGDPEQAGRDVEAMIQCARQSTAEARRTVGRYRSTSPLSELQAAVDLLAAAGLQVDLRLPPEPLPPSLDPAARRRLLRLVSDLFTESAPLPATLVLTGAGCQVTVELRGQEPAQLVEGADE